MVKWINVFYPLTVEFDVANINRYLHIFLELMKKKYGIFAAYISLDEKPYLYIKKTYFFVSKNVE